MTRNAVGFYWTLPVPWAGFTNLPADIEAAAQMSRTIRYQRDLVRGYARREGYKLIREEVCLEIAPDRGSQEIVAVVEKLNRDGLRMNAVLLLVDFSVVSGWRSHHNLSEWIRRHENVIAVAAEPKEPVDFDIHQHFSDWRRLQQQWIEEKPDRARAARELTDGLLAHGLSYSAIAKRLNEQGLTTTSGRDWTADNLRKFVKGRSA